MAAPLVPIAVKGLASAKTVIAGSQAAGNAASGLGVSTLRQAFNNKSLISSAGRSAFSQEMKPESSNKNKKNADGDERFWSNISNEMTMGKLARRVMANPSLLNTAVNTLMQGQGLGSLKAMSSLMPGNMFESVRQSATNFVSSISRFGLDTGTEGSDLEAMQAPEHEAGIVADTFNRFEDVSKSTKSTVDNTLEQNAFDPEPPKLGAGSQASSKP